MEREQHEREGREGVRELGGYSHACMLYIHACTCLSRVRSVMGPNATQSSSFFLWKSVCLGCAVLLCFLLLV